MPSPDRATTPKEFGAMLRAARERSGVRLELLVERTKISRRLLEALETGEFAKLPNRVFMRLFLQQYLEIIGEAPETWMPGFAAAWQRFEEASEPWHVADPGPAKSHRWLPWLVGILVVACGLAAVVLIERSGNDDEAVVPMPTPELTLPTPPPTAEPVVTPEATPEPTAPAPAAGVLALRALARPCWVEVHVAGEAGTSRLLAAGEEWLVDAGGRPVALVVGDAGALEVSYLDEVRSPVGSDGEVVRLELPPSTTAPRAP